MVPKASWSSMASWSPRCPPDAPQMLPRCLPDASQMLPRCIPDASQMFPSSSLVSPKLTQPTLFWVHCVPQEGGRVQGWESKCWGGFPYFKTKTFFWCLVSRFENVLCFQKIFGTYYKVSISCFLIDTKFISKFVEMFFIEKISFSPILIFVILYKMIFVPKKTKTTEKRNTKQWCTYLSRKLNIFDFQIPRYDR